MSHGGKTARALGGFLCRCVSKFLLGCSRCCANLIEDAMRIRPGAKFSSAAALVVGPHDTCGIRARARRARRPGKPTPAPLGQSVLAASPKPRQQRAHASRARAAIGRAGGRRSFGQFVFQIRHSRSPLPARQIIRRWPAAGSPRNPTTILFGAGRRNPDGADDGRRCAGAAQKNARRPRGLAARAQGANAARASGQLRMSPPRRMSRRWPTAASSRGRRSPDAIQNERRRARRAKGARRPRGTHAPRKKPSIIIPARGGRGLDLDRWPRRPARVG